jgi:hypothetical protein
VGQTGPTGPTGPTGGGSASIDTGTYTGDGTESQAITGIGFQPKYVRIWKRTTSRNTFMVPFETTDTMVDDNVAGMACELNVMKSETNAIISLDSDGFTVDDGGSDGDPNANGGVYNYIAIG